MSKQMDSSPSRRQLLRLEISTLVGLMLKKDFSLQVPESKEFDGLINQTESLLERLHLSLSQSLLDDIKASISNSAMENPLAKGAHLREPIFYSSESAHDFQYKDLAIERYAQDEDWIIKNKGFSITNACIIVEAMVTVQQLKLQFFNEMLKNRPPEEWTTLDIFTFGLDELAQLSNLDKSIIYAFFEAFSVKKSEYNSGFKMLGDFNQAHAFPVIGIGEEKYIVFQTYVLLESIYESPYFWFLEDKRYASLAAEHRGDFTENYAFRRLIDVFDDQHVFKNIELMRNKGTTSNEIDGLVSYDDTIIILQAKSKKMTIEARKGNDSAIKNDFKKAVQQAYDQAYSCAMDLLDDAVYSNNQKITQLISSKKIKKIHIFCVVSDHYPALNFQASQFLEYKTSEIIKAPTIMSVFYLDVMADILKIPLIFLDYINKRALYDEELIGNQEISILGYYIKNNIYFENEKLSRLLIDENFSHEIDIYLISKRGALNAGLKLNGTIIDRCVGNNSGLKNILNQLSRNESSDALRLAFLLLNLSSKAFLELEENLDIIINLAKKDGLPHNVSMSFGEGEEGLTFHCNNLSISKAEDMLISHCKHRKYSFKSKAWFGVLISPSLKIKKILKQEFPWKEREIRLSSSKRDIMIPSTKIGRNEKCPCGSDKKFKKCCM